MTQSFGNYKKIFACPLYASAQLTLVYPPDITRRELKGGNAANPLGKMEWGGEIHLTHFEPKTLQGAVRAAGFQIKDFGVDHIYFPRSNRARLSLTLQNTMNALTGRHCSVAKYVIGRKFSADRFLCE